MGSKRSIQVAVIGGGPAGSTAARALASQGLEVTLFERKSFPRYKLCAGLLTAKTIRCLKRDLDLDPDLLENHGIIYHRLSGFRIYHKRRLVASGRLETPFRLTDRRRYDALLLDMAAASGVRVLTCRDITEIDPEAGMVTTASGKNFHAQIIIGADGVWSKARAALLQAQKIPPGKWHRNLAMAIEARAPGFGLSPVPSHAELYFGYLPRGYGWSFPSFRQRLVGICGLGKKCYKMLGSKFRKMLADLQFAPGQATTLGAWPLPYGNYLARPWHGRILLVGDACGLADPLLGEGIYYAHRSSILAAEAVIAAKSQYETAGPVYQDLLNGEILSQMRWIKFTRNLFFGLGRLGPKALSSLMSRHGILVQRAIQGQIPFRSLLKKVITGNYLPG